MREYDHAHSTHFLGTDLKHIVIVCLSAQTDQQAPCIDFIPMWRSVFLNSLTNSSQEPSFISTNATISPSSLSSLMKTKSWVDLLNQDVQIFNVIETLYGVLGCVALLEYPVAEMTKEAADGVYWLTENKETKHCLELHVNVTSLILFYANTIKDKTPFGADFL
jgi:hypothetical protein